MTNEAKPSQKAAVIALAHLGRWTNSLYTQRDLALAIDDAIDSAIADAVRKEAEECAKVADKYRRPYGIDIGKEIRARHTPDSKEQPR